MCKGILYTITASRPDGAEFAAAEDVFDHFMTNFHFTDANPTPAELDGSAGATTILEEAAQ